MKACLSSLTPEFAEYSYSPSPEWTMPQALAEEHIAQISSYDATYWKRHHCRFQIEEVSPGRFAIVCPDHPKLRRRDMLRAE